MAKPFPSAHRRRSSSQQHLSQKTSNQPSDWAANIRAVRNGLRTFTQAFDWPKAQKAAAALVRFAPDDPATASALRNYLLAAANAGSWTAAQQAAEALLQVPPSNPTAATELRNLLETNVGRMQVAISKLQTATSNGQWQSAQQTAETLLQIAPGDPNTANALRSYFRSTVDGGTWTQARRAAKTLLQIVPHDSDAVAALCSSLDVAIEARHWTDIQKAAQAISEATAPGTGERMWLRTAIESGLDDCIEQAVQALIETSPNAPASIALLRDLVHTAGLQCNWERLRNTVKTILEIVPGDRRTIDVIHQLLLAYSGEIDFNQTQKIAELFSEITIPGEGERLWLRAAKEADDWVSIRVSAKRLAQALPGDHEAIDALRTSLRNAVKAEDCFRSRLTAEALLKVTPSDPEAIEALRICLVVAVDHNDKEQAERSAKLLQEVAPNDQDTIERLNARLESTNLDDAGTRHIIAGILAHINYGSAEALRKPTADSPRRHTIKPHLSSSPPRQVKKAARARTRLERTAPEQPPKHATSTFNPEVGDLGFDTEEVIIGA